MCLGFSRPLLTVAMLGAWLGSPPLIVAFAESLPAAPVEELLAKGATPQETAESRDITAINRLFLKSMASIEADRIGQSSEELARMQTIARELGLLNLPDVSFALLEQAESFRERREPEKSRFLVRQAIQISPYDERVALSAISFMSDVGLLESLEYLVRGGRVFWTYPSAFAALISNTIIVFLVALTLSFVFGCVCFISRNTALLIYSFLPVVPFRYRDRQSAWVFLAFLLLPLLSGVLVALTVWSFAIGYSERRRSWLTVVIGLLSIAWGGGIPFVSVLRTNLKSEALRVAEQLNEASYSPTYLATLEQAVQKAPEDLLLQMSRVKLLIIERRDDEATKLLEAFETALESDPLLGGMAEVMRGVLAYRQGDFERARDHLLSAEKLGFVNFELWSNLAQVSIALTDTERYRSYYNEAARIESKHNFWLTKLPLRDTEMLLPRLPAAIFVDRVFASEIALKTFLGKSAPQWIPLVSLLGPGETPASLVGLGVTVCVLSTLVFGRRKRRVRVHRVPAQAVTPVSRFWLLLPGGGDLVENELGRGVLTLTAFFTMLLLSTDYPVQLTPLSPVPVMSSVPYVFAAVIIAGISGVNGLTMMKNRVTQLSGGRRE